MSDWLDAEAHADRALEWFERGRWAEAEAELRKAISLNPDQPEWHFNLALTLEAAGRDGEALTSYERAIDLLPDQIEPRVAAGIVCNRLNRPADAIERFDQALRIDRTSESAYAHKMESHLRLGDHDELETTFYLSQHELAEPSAQCLAVLAESLVQRELFDRAEWCLKEAVRLDGGMPRLRARLGAIFAATGRPQRALQMFLRDLRDDPGNVDTLLDYGELLLDLGRLPDAAEKFRRVLELEPANVDAHHRLGRIALRSRRLEQANLEFELVFKLDAEYPGIRLDIADALLRRGRQREARRHLLQELDRFRAKAQGAEVTIAGRPALLDQRPRFGTLLLKAGMAVEAASVLESVVEDRPTDAELLRKLALALFRAGEREEGVIVSRRVLRLDPTCVRSIHNLALAALEEGRLRFAAGWIARGMQVDRHDVGVRRLRMRLWSALFWGSLRRFFRLG